MEAPELDALYRLHKIDAAIVEIKAKAAALDAGQVQKKSMEALKPEWERAKAEQTRVSGGLKDLETTVQDLRAKIDKIEKLLYGGSVVNPREVEAYQQEIKMFRRHIDEAETKELELLDQQPSVEEAYKQVNSKMSALQKEAKAAYEKAVAEKERLEKEYRSVAAERAQREKAVAPALLKQYDAIRARQGGIGMAEIKHDGSCGRCGTTLPTKVVQAVDDGKIVSCEACHRILISVIPSV
ncbi:MAG: hypothetical protein JST40_01015 [Armatimonadetes bacterium]|nr:hypothetical protein [Armatimonadota bacterium]